MNKILTLADDSIGSRPVPILTGRAPKYLTTCSFALGTNEDGREPGGVSSSFRLVLPLLNLLNTPVSSFVVCYTK